MSQVAAPSPDTTAEAWGELGDRLRPVAIHAFGRCAAEAAARGAGRPPAASRPASDLDILRERLHPESGGQP